MPCSILVLTLLFHSASSQDVVQLIHNKMAQQGVDLYRDQWCCSLCLDVLKDPVTIPCGHSYCMGCITDCWDHDDQRGIYTCPQCRETFTPRPVLKKTNMLAEVIEQLMKTGLQDAPPDHCYAGPADVACDVCTEPKTRADFLQYSSQITLDPNTAHTFVSLSEGNRKATYVYEKQSYPNHPERFIEWRQVLGREGLTGRCYWEVEWSGTWLSVAASYKDISRTGTGVDSGFGYNSKSWALYCSPPGDYIFLYNNKSITVPGPWSSRIGVYLDHRAGTLSFYSVSDTMTLLHRVNTTFTQPLYPGLYVDYFGEAEFCELK